MSSCSGKRFWQTLGRRMRTVPSVRAPRPVRVPIAHLLTHNRPFTSRRDDPSSVFRPNRFRAPSRYPFGLAFGVAGSLVLGAVVLSPVLLIALTGAVGIAAWRLSCRIFPPPTYSVSRTTPPPLFQTLSTLFDGFLPSDSQNFEISLYRSVSRLLESEQLAQQISNILGSPTLTILAPNRTEKSILLINGISRNSVTVYFPVQSPSGLISTVMAVGTVGPKDHVVPTRLVLVSPDGGEHNLHFSEKQGSENSEKPHVFEGEYRELKK